jgi:hypothetical protein
MEGKVRQQKLTPAEKAAAKESVRDRIVAARSREVCSSLDDIAQRTAATEATLGIMVGQLDKLDEIAYTQAQTVAALQSIDRRVDKLSTLQGEFAPRIAVVEALQRRYMAIALTLITAVAGAAATWAFSMLSPAAFEHVTDWLH